jgi:hypothetical protein
VAEQHLLKASAPSRLSTVRLFLNRKQAGPQPHRNSKGGANWISAIMMIAISAVIVTTLRIPVLHVP